MDVRPIEYPMFRSEQVRPGQPYEISEGMLVCREPTGGAGSSGNQLGASVIGWDPAVKEVGVDTGYSPRPHMLRAPDIAVGNVPNRPGWVQGVPDLAIEYADVGQDEADLQKKITELLAAGTRFLWVVRLTGPRRVEVYEPGKKPRLALPNEWLKAPGVLKNPVLVRALYDRDEAERATLVNLLQRQGYDDLDAVLAKGRREGREEGRVEGHEQGLLDGKREVLRRILETRKLGLTKKLAARIADCTDGRKLDRWLDRALVAGSADEVFKRSARS